MAPLAGTRRYYQHLPATYSFESAQTPGSPRSTHTDTDAAMEMGGLSVDDKPLPHQVLQAGHQLLTGWDIVP